MWGKFGWTGLYNLLEIFFMISGFFIALSALKPKPWDPVVVVDHITSAPIVCGCIICFSVLIVFVLVALMALARGHFDGNYGLLDAVVKNYYSEGFSLNLFKNIFLLQAFSIQHYEINYNYPGWSLSVEVFGGAVLFAVLSRFQGTSGLDYCVFWLFLLGFVATRLQLTRSACPRIQRFCGRGFVAFLYGRVYRCIYFHTSLKNPMVKNLAVFEPLIWIAMLYILWRPDSPHAYKDYMMLPFGALFVIMLTKSESLSQKIFFNRTI